VDLVLGMLFKPGHLRILASFTLWKAALLIVILFSPFIFRLQPSFLATGPTDFQKKPTIWAHANFDGNHYLTIAKSGYGYAQQAFFPLFPALIKELSKVSHLNYEISALLISNSCFFMALVVLYELLKFDLPFGLITLTIAVVLVFPTSFFFGAVYTESVFLLLALLSFYCARKGKWMLSGLLGALATATRFVGIVLIPSIVIEWWLQRKSNKTNIPTYGNIISTLMIIPLGLFHYMWFLEKSTGDPLAFIHTLSKFGDYRSEKIILLYQVFWRYLKMLLTVNKADPLFMTIVLESVIGFVFLVTSVISFKTQRLSYAVFNFLAYLLPTLTGSFVSLPRYVLVCFPSFIAIAQFLYKKKLLCLIYLSLSAISLIYFWAKFAMGYWVG